MFACILLPSFQLQAALRFEPQLHRQPVALLTSEGPSGAIITQCTTAARAAEVIPGLTASQALARCPGLHFRRRMPAQEDIAAEVLKQTAWAFSPWLEETAEGVVTLDLRSRRESEHRAWALDFTRRLLARQLHARIGVGANPDLARLIAGRAKPFLQVDEPAAFLAPLALSDLQPEPVLKMILHGWGVHTLGALTALPREAVGDRLGPASVELWDRAAGRTERPLHFARPVESFRETIELEHGLETLEPLLFLVRRCLLQLTGRLADRWLVVAALQLGLRCSDDSHHEREFIIPDPTGDVDVLFRVVQHYFETLRTETTVVGLELSARPAEPVGQQFGMFQASLKNPNGFAETLARLTAIVGPNRLGTPRIESTHRPDAFTMHDVDFRTAPAPVASVAEDSPRYGPALRRYRPALAATVLCDASGRPLHLESAAARGHVHSALGPWRGSGDWWEEKTTWDEEEWDIEIAPGQILRLGRSASAWRVVGGYD